MNEVSPDVVALCETKRGVCSRRKKEEITGYEVIEKNTKKGKEGLLIAAKLGTFHTIEEVTESELKNILTVRIRYANTVVRIVVLHSPQESDSTEVRTEFYEELTVQIQRSITAGDELIVVGDFNARIQPDCQVDSSPNGSLLQQLIDECEMEVANFNPITEGLWTRIQKKSNGTECKSTIDYVLIQKDLSDMMQSMIIDELK